eukprot:6307319-Amphidinium_carterae.1
MKCWSAIVDSGNCQTASAHECCKPHLRFKSFKLTLLILADDLPGNLIKPHQIERKIKKRKRSKKNDNNQDANEHKEKGQQHEAPKIMMCHQR